LKTNGKSTHLRKKKKKFKSHHILSHVTHEFFLSTISVSEVCFFFSQNYTTSTRFIQGRRPGRRKSAKAGSRAKNKKYKKALALKHYAKDLDQRKKLIEAEEKKLARGEKVEPPPFDEDLPGGGQFYCKETDRHFISGAALATHKKSKRFRRALKQLKEKMYSQEEAEAAAGKTKESHIAPPTSK